MNRIKPAPSAGNSQPITIQLPNRIIERADKYARENNDTITGVIIEALDSFLRRQEIQ